jgi:glycosyltransferase involved in cell wall biosynthesis
MIATTVNLLPILKGGGMQNALSYLKTLAADEQRRSRVRVLCQDETPLADFSRKHFSKPVIVKRGTISRLAAEAKGFPDAGAELCFTLFGAPSFGSRGKFINVCGCAYSNLLYPELDFWNFLTGFAYQKKQFIDLLRKKTLKMADFWIFETEILRRRAVKLFNFPENRVAVVRMAPSGYVRKDQVDPTVTARIEKQLRPGFRLLMLSGAHPNKQQALLPDLIEAMVKNGLKEFSFVTTMNAADTYCRRVVGEIARRGLSVHLTNIGPVPAVECASLIDICSAVVCFSRLESFSNNFVEAWQMQKPLVVTDGDWSREACGGGGIYVDPANAAECARALQELIRNPDFQRQLVEEGSRVLKTYNTPETKYEEYWRTLETARNLGVCPPGERRQIRW